MNENSRKIKVIAGGLSVISDHGLFEDINLGIQFGHMLGVLINGTLGICPTTNFLATTPTF
jgi:hypothetical protein